MLYTIPIDARNKLSQIYSGLSIRDDKVILKHPKHNAVIPSKLYPLNTKKNIALFTAYNTTPVEDENIKKVFNSLDLPVGRCYTNTMKIAKALTEHGITDFKPYVGWVTPPNGLPIHHCWMVVNENHVLDAGVSKSELKFTQYVQEHGISDLEEARKILAEMYVQEMDQPNSDVKICGQVIPTHWYVGTPCSPEVGAEIFRTLSSSYPNHPSYQNQGQNMNGRSRTQEMIEQLKKQR